MTARSLMPPRPIDPLVDYAFKRVFGTVATIPLWRHFLNSIIKPQVPFAELTLLNPMNEREFEESKLTVVDVKARDADGRVVQVEVQLLTHAALTARMLYTWAEIYRNQMTRGDDFDALFPVVSVWIVASSFLPGTACHSRFELLDRSSLVRLSDHVEFHVLELPKAMPGLAEEDAWIHFLKEAGAWTERPHPLAAIAELRDAMAILNDISQGEADYELYARRLYLQRLEATVQKRLARLEDAERQIAAAEHQIAAAEQAAAAAEQTAAENARRVEELTAENARLRAQVAPQGD